MNILISAFKNIFRNFWLSIASIVIILLMLFSISLIYTINTISQTMLESFEQKMDLSIYLKQNINQDTIESLKAELKKLEQVKEIKYLNPAESLEKFKERHKANQDILNSLEELGENPLGATITLKFQDPTAYQSVLSIISNPNYEKIIQDQDFHDYQKLIDTFNNFNRKIYFIGSFISILFLLISLLVIFNSIKLGAIHKQEEIQIMRLMGATSWLIKAPFLIEGIIYATSAWILNVLILAGISWSIESRIQKFLEIDFNIYEQLETNGISFLFILLIYAVIISITGSSLAIKKYLKF
ncbi:FtsX-like permease family protein [Patescibacteria group bacterium]|nr:FtsX-like permease family protein [Patescibacteria group bacterium]